MRRSTIVAVVAIVTTAWSGATIAAAGVIPPDSAATGNRPVPAPTSAPPPLPPGAPCPVTLPTFDPPPGEPVPTEPSYFGNGKLWTMPWPEGRVVFAPNGPGFVLPDGSLGMKWPWFPTVPGELTVEGRRLDGPAPPAWAEIGEGFTDRGRFFPTYLIFPTAGCWEITGRVGEASLTFVTSVVQIGDGPAWRPSAVP